MSAHDARTPLSLRANATARARGAQSVAATQATALISGGDSDTIQEIPLEAIVSNEDQPRKHFDHEALMQLAASIQEHGVLQPVLVRQLALGRYELIAGERRWRASGLAELRTIRAIVLEGVDDLRALEVALLENTAREDLTPVEEARALAALIDELDVSKEAVARRIGKSRAYVSNAVRLLDLPDDVLDLIGAGRLSARHGRELLRLAAQDERRAVGRQAAEAEMSVRALSSLVDGHVPSRPPARTVAPRPADQVALAARIADAISASIAAEVEVRPKGNGFTFYLRSVDAARALAAQLGVAAGELET